MPEGAVYVGRPTKWGNPFQIGSKRIEVGHVTLDRPDGADAGDVVWAYQHALYWDIFPGPLFKSHVREELRGRDLVCWCPLDQPCHADVLLELANGGPE